MNDTFKIVAAVLAHIRGDTTAECVAETFGVTEARVEQWKDIFLVAGVVALTNELTEGGVSGSPVCEGEEGEPTTSTTTPHPPPPPPPTTTPDPHGKAARAPVRKGASSIPVQRK